MDSHPPTTHAPSLQSQLTQSLLGPTVGTKYRPPKRRGGEGVSSERNPDPAPAQSTEHYSQYMSEKYTFNKWSSEESTSFDQGVKKSQSEWTVQYLYFLAAKFIPLYCVFLLYILWMSYFTLFFLYRSGLLKKNESKTLAVKR